MKNTIIVILIVLLLISGLLSWQPAYNLINRYTRGVQPYKVHVDSILVAKKDILELKKKDLAIIAQMMQDSIDRAGERVAYKKEIVRLKRNTARVDFSQSTSTELDSIRGVLFHGPASDTFVIMPIDQAREALAAKAREPFKDSAINAMDMRVWKLEGDLINQEERFKERIVGFQGQHKQKDIQIRNLEAINQKQDEDYKAEKLKGWLKGLAGAAAMFGIMKGSK